ncbi:MAG: hypothetical protein EB127_09755 [Alphaproteobacteria bacterium]|nr:hypothetical protein [Alphaproteobacteria bacterium]
MNIVHIIAKAIKEEDRTYFFEDYTKQARAVLQSLDNKGYILTPKHPTDNMIKAGVLAIQLGDVDARNLAKDIYSTMIEARK